MTDPLSNEMKEEIRKHAEASHDLRDFQEKLKKIAMQQAEDTAVALFSPQASGMSRFQTNLMQRMSDPANELIKKTMGVDSWGTPTKDGVLNRMVTESLGAMVGEQLAKVMEDPRYEDRLRDAIKDVIREKIKSIIGYNFERQVEQAVRELVEKAVLSK